MHTLSVIVLVLSAIAYYAGCFAHLPLLQWAAFGAAFVAVIVAELTHPA